MRLSLRNFSTLVQSMAASVEASAPPLLDLSVGSTLRAVLEANASLGLWMQWLILRVLRTTRAATSDGADLDTWMDDLTLTRLPAAAATGTVTFSRFAPGTSAFIPVGALVRSADGTQTYAVIANAAWAYWSTERDGYVVPTGLSALDVPVMALVAGALGNVRANTVTLLASALPGIDSVNNAGTFQNGLDAESDDAFRGRFRNFIASRSRATPLAIGYAINSIQQGLSYAIQENVDPAGQARNGSFVVTVDDGTGMPSTALLSTIQLAVDSVRPVGTVFTIRPPTVLRCDVSLTVTVPAGTAKAPVQAAVGEAVRTYINRLPIGMDLPLSRLTQIAYSTSTSVINVSEVRANGSTDDVAATPICVVKAGLVAVN